MMQLLKKQNILRTILVISITLFLFSAYFTFFGSSETVKVSVTDIVNTILAGLLVIIIGFCYYTLDSKYDSDSKFILALYASFLCFFIAELIWAYYEAFLGVEIPTPSLADILYYSAYFFILAGLAYKISKTFIYRKKLFIFVMLTIATLVNVYYLVFHLLEDIVPLSYEEAFAYILNYGYIFCDIYVLALTFVLIYNLIGNSNKMVREYLVLALAFLVLGVYDFYFAELILFQGSFYDNFLLILYSLNYTILIYAVYLKSINLLSFNKISESEDINKIFKPPKSTIKIKRGRK